MEEKEIDINDEEQILKECDFDYFYNLEKCSKELCMFYNDIGHQNSDFNTRQAFIDLGRIAITLNQQDKHIKELKQSQKRLAIEILEELKDKFFKIGHDKNYDIAFYRVIAVIEENLRNLYNGV